MFCELFEIQQQKATMKTVEGKDAKHAKVSAAPKYEELPEIPDYERTELEKFDKPEFGKAKKVRCDSVFLTLLLLCIFFAIAFSFLQNMKTLRESKREREKWFL